MGIWELADTIENPTYIGITQVLKPRLSYAEFIPFYTAQAMSFRKFV